MLPRSAAARARDAERAHRNLCFTWNNPPDDFLLDLSHCGELVRYAIASLEIGENGTPHYQGYASFNRGVRYRQAARELGMPEGKVHFEPANGTAAENKAYITKDPWYTTEFGDLKEVGQGKRSDLAAAAAAAADVTIPMCDVILQHSSAAMRYSKNMNVVRAAALVKERQNIPAITKRREVKTTVYWGPAGSGKTTRALKRKDLFILPSNDRDGVIWFDGYMGQKNILIEDFTPNCIGQKALLNICDGAPMAFAVKGAFVPAEWTAVYITSNYHPKNWFTHIEPETQRALARRLNRIKEVKLPPNRFGADDQEIKWADASDQDESGSDTSSESDSDIQIIE